MTKPTAKGRGRGPTIVKLPILKRVMKAAALSGIPHRIVVDPRTGVIEMIPADQAPAPEVNEWDR